MQTIEPPPCFSITGVTSFAIRITGLDDHCVGAIPVFFRYLQEITLRRPPNMHEDGIDTAIGLHCEIEDPVNVLGALGDTAARDAIKLGSKVFAAFRWRHQ